MVVLGASGMLGHRVMGELVNSRVEVVPIAGKSHGGPDLSSPRSLVDALDQLNLNEKDVLINTAGIVKSLLHHSKREGVESALRVNSLLPHTLAQYLESRGTMVIQPATDCVFSGKEGRYIESSLHDPVDTYGKTKSLGEISSPNFLHVRASFLGPEVGTARMLFEWLNSQALRATVYGFVNHYWNGVSTTLLAKVFLGLVLDATDLRGTFHLVPNDFVSKFELLHLLKGEIRREDIRILPAFGPESVNRVLGTEHPEVNEYLWKVAGFAGPLSIAETVSMLGRQT